MWRALERRLRLISPPASPDRAGKGGICGLEVHTLRPLVQVRHAVSSHSVSAHRWPAARGPVRARRCQSGVWTHLARVGSRLPRKRARLCPDRPPPARSAAARCWAVGAEGVRHQAQPPRLLLQQHLGGAAHRRAQACPAAPPPSISPPRTRQGRQERPRARGSPSACTFMAC